MVPTELGRQQGGDVVGRGRALVAGQEQGARAAGQDVLDVLRHLVTGGVHRLAPRVGERRDQRFGQRAIGGDHGGDRAGIGPVPLREVTEHVGVEAEAGGGTRFGERFDADGASQRQLLRPALGLLVAQLIDHGVDGVGRHAAIRRELAARDGDDAARRARHLVPAGQVGGPLAVGAGHERA